MDPQRYAEKLISEAIERGELEPAEGTGEPFAAMSMDPDWWVRAFLERERLPERWDELDGIRRAETDRAIADPDLSAARRRLAALNETLSRWNLQVPESDRFQIHNEIWLLDRRAERPID